MAGNDANIPGNPLDRISDRKRSLRNALAELDIGFLRDNAAWAEAYKTMDWSKIECVDQLVKSTEQIVLKYPKPVDPIKKAISSVFEEVLLRYPLFFGYWRRYTAVEYQLNGIESSIEVLSNAVESFPSSVEIWCDYLSVLMANRSEKVDMIKINFEIARTHVGWHFLSHPFWDKYIQFETKRECWPELNEIYRAVCKIPLHQYARYYTAYKSFLEQHSELASHEIEDIFPRTQRLVAKVWPFESKISKPFFDLTPVTQTDLENWNNYLNSVISSDSLPKEAAEMLFERCLVPCQYHEHFWKRYAKWMNNHSDFEHIVETFKRGSKALPDHCLSFRRDFIKYLDAQLNEEDVSRKSQVLYEELIEYAAYWPRRSELVHEYINCRKRTDFTSSLDEDDQQILKQQTAYTNYLHVNINAFFAKNSEGDIQLERLLDADSISVLIVELIKMTFFTLKNNIQTRKFFNEFRREPQLKNSVAFWLIYYKVLKVTRAFEELEAFVDELGNKIFLPTLVINDILKDLQSFFLTNLNFRSYDNATSRSKYSRTIDPIIELEFKLNDPQWVKAKLNESKLNDIKESGHPGIIIERPEISNSIVELNSAFFNNCAHSLPSFRNLEKVTKPPAYVNHFKSDYLVPK
ncbi:LAMI_0D10264g1_1 [Lachancea mirantina]|uniref:LAMI_0D10264g1_1 n=1 Tax=Lachancea mirantina TaxID=1230905 RepID=A0A1G4JE49_9SACH|nr:LAMI_0D10264g1_1 [Lachancea mirantina]